MFPDPERLPGGLAAAFQAGSLPSRIDGLVGPADQPWPAEVRAKRPSSVALLLVPPARPGEPARVILTRRSTTVRSHKGQIGLAGGRAEADDPSPAVTALRELEEELGVPRDVVFPVGTLAPTVALDGSPVVPVVALTAFDLDDMVPAPAEVDHVFAEPWTAFTPERDRLFRFNIFGHWRTSHLFDLPERPSPRVWGLTAHILASARLA